MEKDITFKLPWNIKRIAVELEARAKVTFMYVTTLR
jgi:hypothetical protein